MIFLKTFYPDSLFESITTDVYSKGIKEILVIFHETIFLIEKCLVSNKYARIRKNHSFKHTVSILYKRKMIYKTSDILKKIIYFSYFCPIYFVTLKIY